MGRRRARYIHSGVIQKQHMTINRQVGSMSGVSVPLRTAKEVKDRLQAFYTAGAAPRFESQSALARHLGIPRPTIAGWFQGQPKVPDPAHMIVMAVKDRLSPTWLLLGQGPELIGAALP